MCHDDSGGEQNIMEVDYTGYVIEIPYYKADSIKHEYKIMSVAEGASIFNVAFSKFQNENFLCLSINRQNEPISLNSFDIESSGKDMKRVLQFAIMLNANSIMIGCRREQEDLTPNPDDVKLANKFVKVSAIFKIQIFDYILINGDKWFSFSKANLLEKKGLQKDV